MRIIFCTTPPAKAEEIARKLLDERLIACANIVPNLHSLYWWKGKIETAGESLLIMKTRNKQVAAAMRRIQSLHPYEVPEIVAVPVDSAHGPYAEWVRDMTRAPYRAAGEPAAPKPVRKASRRGK